MNNVLDYEQAAPERLSEMAYAYYVAGAWDERTVRENREAFGRLWLNPRGNPEAKTRAAPGLFLPGTFTPTGARG